uniref:LOB domain-containing protein n=1 Tax=Ananas comosus var. bracteatus TaxID=296719 RepID=A0A6V7QHQ8_ANACO|nr:unnamed protein product [Ananas comosus var. bracteatus]
MSCNGCRVLRKGCSAGCAIRSCLQWIRSPDSQANATVFLAKFYGRAGLLNLISSCPLHLRSFVVIRGCGRVLDPVCGSVGLLWSGNWQLCQAAVEAVLKGAPITQMPAMLSGGGVSPLKTYDIRHVAKNTDRVGVAAKSRSGSSGPDRHAASPKWNSLTGPSFTRPSRATNRTGK